MWWNYYWPMPWFGPLCPRNPACCRSDASEYRSGRDLSNGEDASEEVSNV